MGKKDSPIDVLLITAVKDELDVVLNVEPDWQPKEDNKGFTYYTRKVIGNRGNEFTIAAARPIDMGGDFASNIATRLVNELKPCCLAMVGICAGWRGKVFLGDVIVADRVFRYDAGKLKAFRNGDIKTEEVFRDIRTYNLNPLWVQKAQDFPPDWISTVQTKRPLSYSYQELWLLYAQEAFESGKGKNLVDLDEMNTQCPDWTEVLKRLVDKELIEVDEDLKITENGKSRVAEHKIRYPDGIPPEQDKPKTYVAPMGTVSQVKEDPDLFPTIARYMRNVLAIEMEAAAIGAVAEIENVDSCIIVNGVADYADPERDDYFRFYAIEASYRFLMAFLKENLILQSRRKVPLVLPQLDVSTYTDREDKVFPFMKFENMNSTENKMPRIFLAHAKEDKEQVYNLYLKLKDVGFNPWFDEKELLPGQVWEDEILNAIHNSDFFLACLSKKSVAKKGYVQKEYRTALDLYAERPFGDIYLIPVRLDDCKVPDLKVGTINLRDFQWVDFFKPDGFKKIIESIKLQSSEITGD